MDSRCQATHESLVEQWGDADQLAAEERQHLAECVACREVAEHERLLGATLARAVPEADPQLQQAIVDAVAGSRLRHRLLGLLPVAASLLVGAIGTLLMGGIPGLSLLELLPLWSSQGWISLVQAVADWTIVLVAAASALSTELPATVPLVAGLIAAAGLAGLAVAAVRHRKLRAWQRNS